MNYISIQTSLMQQVEPQVSAFALFIGKITGFISEHGIELLALYIAIVVALVIFLAQDTKLDFAKRYQMSRFLNTQNLVFLVIEILIIFLCGLEGFTFFRCLLIVTFFTLFYLLTREFVKLIKNKFETNYTDAIKWASEQGFYTDEFWEYLFSNDLYDINNKDKKYEVGESASYLCKTIFKAYRNHLVEKRHTFSYYPLYKVLDIYFSSDIREKRNFVYDNALISEIMNSFVVISNLESSENRNFDTISCIDLIIQESFLNKELDLFHHLIHSKEKYGFDLVPSEEFFEEFLDILYENVDSFLEERNENEIIFNNDLRDFLIGKKGNHLELFNRVKCEVLFSKLSGDFLKEKNLETHIKFLEIVGLEKDRDFRVAFLRLIWFVIEFRKHGLQNLVFLDSLNEEELAEFFKIDFYTLYKSKSELCSFIDKEFQDKVRSVLEKYQEELKGLETDLREDDPYEIKESISKKQKICRVVENINSLLNNE